MGACVEKGKEVHVDNVIWKLKLPFFHASDNLQKIVSFICESQNGHGGMPCLYQSVVE